MSESDQIPRYTLARGMRSFTIGSLVGLVMMMLFSPMSMPYVGKAWRTASATEQSFEASQGKDRQADCEAARSVAEAWLGAGYKDKHKDWLARADTLCNGPAIPL